jgi:sulfane dehydrogenase subunit SoxC
MPDGSIRQFTYAMEAKSLITWPSAGHVIPALGFWEISGIAWSGRGRIERVEVSVDGGATWADAELVEPVLPLSHTRFKHGWTWDGRATTILSRATDETGYLQPTREELLAVRGENYVYHYNGIQPWDVAADGRVTNGYA